MDEQLVAAKANETSALPETEAKKAYAQPAIVYRGVLEAMAANCNGANGKSSAPCTKLSS